MNSVCPSKRKQTVNQMIAGNEKFRLFSTAGVKHELFVFEDSGEILC